jgi:pyruvate formate lyase activating enzyme
MKRAAGCAAALMLADGLSKPGPRRASAAPAASTLHECMFYEKVDDGSVRCGICPRGCEVARGGRGFCGVRENQGGVYRSLVYDKVCTLNVDPIEKKPFFHYLPGTDAVSIATAGCNMTCKFCQNWQISQFKPEQVKHTDLPAAQLVELTKERKVRTIAYTYSEPTIFYENVHDVAKLGRAGGVGSVLVSNGYMNEQPMKQLLEHLTAVKVDLKAFTDKFYDEVTGGSLQPVLDTIARVHKAGIHLEIVVLLIPTLNDGEKELKEMADWVVKTVGPDVPMHFSRFHPTYKMQNLPRTPVQTLETARDLAMKAGVHFAYIGNVPLHEGANTFCPKCRTEIIERVGYRLVRNDVRDGKCGTCGRPIAGVWTQEQALASKPKK